MNRLKELREGRGLNMRQVASMLNYKYMTYVNYEKGERELYSEQLIKIADFYDVSIDYLLCRDEKVIQVKQPLVQKYEKLDETSQAVVDAVMDIESKRMDKVQSKVQRIIPLFPAAAGPGEPTEGNVFETVETDNEKADFAVRISGDSMEPEFQEGEIVLCKRQSVKTGDIAVFMIGGFLLVKQFVDGYNGQFYLLSLNRDRKDLDYTHFASGNDNPILLGVVMHKRIPLVEQ